MIRRRRRRRSSSASTTLAGRCPAAGAVVVAAAAAADVTPCFFRGGGRVRACTNAIAIAVAFPRPARSVTGTTTGTTTGTSTTRRLHRSSRHGGGARTAVAAAGTTIERGRATRRGYTATRKKELFRPKAMPGSDVIHGRTTARPSPAPVPEGPVQGVGKRRGGIIISAIVVTAGQRQRRIVRQRAFCLLLPPLPFPLRGAAGSPVARPELRGRRDPSGPRVHNSV